MIASMQRFAAVGCSANHLIMIYSPADRDCCSVSSTTDCSNMPSTAGTRSLTTIISPGRNPSPMIATCRVTLNRFSGVRKTGDLIDRKINQAAKTAGIKTIAIETTLDRTYLQEADIIVQSFTEVQSAIEEMLDK